MSIPVPPEEAEAAVARLLELVPEGHEVTPTGLAVYVDEQQLRALTSAFPAATVEQVEPGWEDAWRRFHTGVRIGPFWVGPPWEQPPAEALPIVIDPGRAFDTDAVAIEVTRENARRNGVTLEAAMLDARTDALDADVVIANIALDVVEALATHVRCRDLVLSGYLAGDRPAVPGLVHVARRERDGWAADSYRPE